MAKGYKEFAAAVKKRESDNNYEIVNKFGFMGAYQFGAPRLYDLGISINGWCPKNKPAKKFLALNDFLKNHDLQDQLFDTHVRSLSLYIKRNFKEHLGKSYLLGGKWITLTLSGMVAGAHLVGLGGLRRYIQGENIKDGFGTSPEEYITKFAGYALHEKE